MKPELSELALLLRQRNEIDEKLSRLIGRPAIPGHIGEFIAAAIFDIDLNSSACQKGCDGTFHTGPLAGRTVNVKLYGKQEGLLDIREDALPDFYLILTGPRAAAVSSRGTSRLMIIDHVYLFEAKGILTALRERVVKLSVASSVAQHLWQAAEIWPTPTNLLITLQSDQKEALALFRTDAGT